MSQVGKTIRDNIAASATREFGNHMITEIKFIGLGTEYFIAKVQ